MNISDDAANEPQMRKAALRRGWARHFLGKKQNRYSTSNYKAGFAQK
jgi:hypothetical protein